MKQLWTLIKYNYKSLYGFHGFKYSWKYEKEKLYLNFFIYGLLLLLFYNIFKAYIQINKFLYYNLTLTREQNLMIEGLLNFTFLLLLTFGLAGSYISTVSNSRENSYVMTLPLKPWQILLSRFVPGYIFQLLLSLFALMPVLIINGITFNEPFTYYVFACVVIVLIPVIPMALQFFVFVLIQRAGYFFDKRGFANITAFIINIVFIILLKEITGMQNYFEANKNTGVSIIKEKLSLLVDFSKIFYPVNIAYKAITEKVIISFKYLLIFIFISLIGLILILKLLSSSLVDVISRSEEISNKNKQKVYNMEGLLFKRQSEVMALLQRDIKLFYRDSTFVIYGFAMTLIIPFLSLYSLYSGMPDLLKVVSDIEKDLNAKYFITLLIALGYVLVGGFNMIASTALSREGKMFYYLKSLPINPQEYIKAKLLHCNILSIIFGILTCSFSFFVTGLSLIYLVLAFMIGFFILNIYFIIGLFCEFCIPMLNWENPRVVVRQNINVLISMVLLILFVILSINVVTRISKLAIYMPYIAIGLGIITFAFYKFLIYFGNRRYYQIE
ncbi:MAG TPA: ABC transporter permease [Clostridia bacterium]|nr:ABC transporter permease [Clostridia bacterium]